VPPGAARTPAPPSLRHCSEVADVSVSCRGDVADLSRTSRGSRRNGILP